MCSSDLNLCSGEIKNKFFGANESPYCRGFDELNHRHRRAQPPDDCNADTEFIDLDDLTEAKGPVLRRAQQPALLLWPLSVL